MANRVLCIEIGNRMTHVVETDFKVKEPKIYKSFSFQTPDNLFKEETLADVLPFKERLDAGLEEHKIKTRKAVFVLASSRIASRDVVIPHVKENRIRTLLYANSAEYFPVDLEKYQLSYRLLDEVEEEGEQKYKLMVLAVPNEMIDAYKSLAKVCLLTLVDLDYIGNAATQLLEKNIKNDLYAAVRLEEDTTMITIVRENKIELQRTFPYGIADVIQAVQKSAEFREEVTEKLEKYNISEAEITPQNTATLKRYEKQCLSTDTGVEIKIPMEQYRSGDSIEFITNEDGSISILIKNIGHITSKM